MNTQCNKVHGGVGNYLPAYDSTCPCVPKYVYTHMQASEANHPLKSDIPTRLPPAACTRSDNSAGQPGRPVARYSLYLTMGSAWALFLFSSHHPRHAALLFGFSC